MPGRLIVVIVIFAIYLTFITFNLDNRCNISFGFVKFENVPVFLTVFASFVFGIFCTLPFLLRALTKRKERRERRREREREREDDYPHERTERIDDQHESQAEPVDAAKARKKFLSRWKNKKPSDGGSKE
jgi:uncharacterized integral membrane protein